MMWVNETSLPHDWELERAWALVNQHSQAAGIPHTVQLRLTASCGDLLSMVSVVRELLALEELRRRAQILTSLTLTPIEQAQAWRAGSSHILREGNRLAASIKAQFFFARAFCDAAYAVFLFATGDRAGKHTSLQNGLKTEHSQLATALDQEVPGFISWFREMRDLRNTMKTGIGTSHGASLKDGHCTVRITLQEVTDNPRAVNLGKELTANDLENSIVWPARFLQFVSRVVVERGTARA